jgi:hypothetical protein
VLPWLWTAVVTLVTIAMAVSTARSEDLGSPVEFVAGLGLFATFPATTALGAVLRMKTPENPISWLFFMMGAGLPLVTWSATVVSADSPPVDPPILLLSIPGSMSTSHCYCRAPPPVRP